MARPRVLGLVLAGWVLLTVPGAFAQEDRMVQLAIETVKAQMRLPKGAEVKFVEKKESPIPGFYSVKLSFMGADREIPLIVYVAPEGEKVILGSLFVKGENVTRKEAGEPKPRKLEMGQLELDRSLVRGPAGARITVVEFSNFQCPYCVRSWKTVKELMDKYPQDINYVFKHFPLPSQKKSAELSEMVAALEGVNRDAFWMLHDFFFSDEGQKLVNLEREALKKRIEELLEGKGYDVKGFQSALETGKGKKRVDEDAALGQKLGVRGTPTTVVNGEFRVGPVTDKTIEEYLKK